MNHKLLLMISRVNFRKKILELCYRNTFRHMISDQTQNRVKLRSHITVSNLSSNAENNFYSLARPPRGPPYRHHLPYYDFGPLEISEIK